jgi:hypothetical protein
VSCSKNYVESLIHRKDGGNAENLQNIVYFEEYDSEKTASDQMEDHERLKYKGSKCGLNVYTFNEVLQAG